LRTTLFYHRPTDLSRQPLDIKQFQGNFYRAGGLTFYKKQTVDIFPLRSKRSAMFTFSVLLAISAASVLIISTAHSPEHFS